MARIGPRGANLDSGELITLHASAARTTGGNGAPVRLNGERRRLLVVCAITASADVAGDVGNIFVDYSLDDVTYYNAIHFTEQAGDGGAVTYYAVLNMAGAPATTNTNVTADAASGVVRPYAFGPYVRARWAITDAGAHGQSHTFSVIAWAE